MEGAGSGQAIFARLSVAWEWSKTKRAVFFPGGTRSRQFGGLAQTVQGLGQTDSAIAIHIRALSGRQGLTACRSQAGDDIHQVHVTVTVDVPLQVLRVRRQNGQPGGHKSLVAQEVGVQTIAAQGTPCAVRGIALVSEENIFFPGQVSYRLVIRADDRSVAASKTVPRVRGNGGENGGDKGGTGLIDHDFEVEFDRTGGDAGEDIVGPFHDQHKIGSGPIVFVSVVASEVGSVVSDEDGSQTSYACVGSFASLAGIENCCRPVDYF